MMKKSKFKFIVITFFLMMIMPCAAQAVVNRDTSDVSLDTLKEGHPRVFVDSWEEIYNKIENDPTCKQWYEMTDYANEYFINVQEDAIKKKEEAAGTQIKNSELTVFRFDVAGLSLGYKYEKHKADIETDPIKKAEYEENAQERKDLLYRLLKNTPFDNPEQIMYSNYAARNFTIAYDWLYEDWSDEERTFIESFLSHHMESYWTWPERYNCKHNYNHVTNAAAMTAAVAIGDLPQYKELAEKTLKEAVYRLDTDYFEPWAPGEKGGATLEGPQYEAFSTYELISGIAAIDSALGTTFGIAEEPGIENIGDFYMYVRSPRLSMDFQYGDGSPDEFFKRTPQLLWLADKFDRPEFAWSEVEVSKYNGVQNNYNTRFERGMNIVWYNPEKGVSTMEDVPYDVHFDSNEASLMKSAWKNPNSIYYGIKGGDGQRGSEYHRHIDSGTIAITALGESFVSNTGMGDYSLKEYGGAIRVYYPQRKEGNNCLVINPQYEFYDEGRTRSETITKSNDLEAYTITDLSADYQGKAQSVKRGLRLFDNRRMMLLQDEATAIPGKSLDSYWFIQTKARIDLQEDNTAAILTVNGKKLYAKILEPSNATFDIMRCEPMIYTPRTGSNFSDIANAKKLSIHLNEDDNLKVSVLFAPLRDYETPEDIVMPEVTDMDEWSLDETTPVALLSDIKVNGETIDYFETRNFTYDIKTDGIPEITAEGKDGANVSINQATEVPGRAEITVTADGKQTSVYYIYIEDKDDNKYGYENVTVWMWDGLREDYWAVKPTKMWQYTFFANRSGTLEKDQWMDYDLGEAKNVGAVAVAFEKANYMVSPFKIEASNDKEHWEEVLNTETEIISSNRAFVQPFALNKSVNARYFRVTSTEKTINPLYVRFFASLEDAERYKNQQVTPGLDNIQVTVSNNGVAEVGETLETTIKGLDFWKEEYHLDGAEVQYFIENENVATVDETGVITAKNDGITFLKLILNKDNREFHKRVKITVNESGLLRIAPDKTAYIRTDKATTNYSTEDVMKSKSNMRGYMQFDVSKYSEVPFEKVILRLTSGKTTITDENETNTLSVVGDDWEENSLTADNAPQISADGITFDAPEQINTAIDIDVTELFTREAMGDGKLSFSFTSDSGEEITYYSTRANVAEYKPQLIVYRKDMPTAESSVSVTDDTFVFANGDEVKGDNVVHGAEDVMEARDSSLLWRRKSFVKFDQIDNVDAVNLVSAKVEFSVKEIGNNAESAVLDLYKESDTWSEDTLQFANLGEYNLSGERSNAVNLIGSVEISNEKNKTYSVDVTEYIRECIENGKVPSISIDSKSTDRTYIYTKDANVADELKPRIVYEYASGMTVIGLTTVYSGSLEPGSEICANYNLFTTSEAEEVSTYEWLYADTEISENWTVLKSGSTTAGTVTNDTKIVIPDSLEGKYIKFKLRYNDIDNNGGGTEETTPVLVNLKTRGVITEDSSIYMSDDDTHGAEGDLLVRYFDGAVGGLKWSKMTVIKAQVTDKSMNVDDIVSAKIVTTVKEYPTSDLTVSYHKVDSSWNQSTITQDNMGDYGITFPATGEKLGTIEIKDDGTNKIAFDVTEYLKETLRSGKDTLSIQLVGEVSYVDTTTLRLYSLENGKDAPVFEIQYNDNSSSEKSIAVTNQDGETVVNIKNGDTITANLDADGIESATMVMALYDEAGVLKTTKIVEETVDSKYTQSITIPDDGNVYVLKVFAFEDMDNVTPLDGINHVELNFSAVNN